MTSIPLSRANALATPNNPDTDWFQAARYGVFVHLLPGSDAQLALVKSIDTDALAGEVEAMGAKFMVLTLGQNTGYYISPNAVYDRYTGYAPGERCSSRDLPLDLYHALHARGIKLMLYLPCQTPNEDPRAQKAFGLPQGRDNQPCDPVFAAKWGEVIQEWSDHYGDKVAGWWFDGGYDYIHFNEAIAAPMAAAVKHGNPHALVTFNPGENLVIRHTAAEDYTAGELKEPFAVVPESRWVRGSQWHALTYLGSTWGDRGVRHTDEEWINWVRAVTEKGGVVTLDVGPNWDPQAGPIGSIAEGQLWQMKALKAAIRGEARG